MRHVVTITAGLDIPVSLHQRVNDTFVVMYGHHVKSDLTYEQDATELGACILHSLNCAGLIEMEDPR